MIECAAWDLLGEHATKLATTHLARLAGGHTWYSAARIVHGRKGRVCLMRLEVCPSYRAVSRYVNHDAVVELRPQGECV